MQHEYYEDSERAKGFITNVRFSIRRIIALKLAGWKHGERVIFKNNATDIRGHRIGGYLAVYIPGARDLSEFWRTAKAIQKRLGL